MPSNKGPQGQAARVSSTPTTEADGTPALGRGGHGPHVTPDGTDTTAPALDTVVEQVFTRFDANDDTTLTVAELVTVLDPTGSNGTLATELTAQVTVIDSDGSGTLSKAEVTAAVTALDSDADGLLDRSERATLRDDGNQTLLDSILGGGRHGGGGGRVEVSRSVTDAVEAIFTVYDADGSTTLSLSELVANLHSHRKGTDVSTLASELMAAVDSNSDGALSTTEITAALTALDTDGDGLLERSDHVAGSSDDASVQLIGVLLHHLPVDAVSSVTA